MAKKDKKDKKRKAPALTGLAAALVKAGKLDEKKANKLTREQRRDDRKVGRDVAEKREAEAKARLEAHKAAEAEADRTRQREREARLAGERAQRAVKDDLVPNLGGKTRWFFVARSGLVPFVEVDPLTSRMLQNGAAGIVESQGAVASAHAIVSARALTTLHTLDPDSIRYWNR